MNESLVLLTPRAYPKNLGALNLSSDPLANISVPESLQTAPAGTNVKLWISDPRDPAKGLSRAAAFICLGNNPCKYYPGNSDGSFYVTIENGTYLFDITEPSGMATVFKRKAYKVTVASTGVTVADRAANSSGVVAVTLDLQSAINPMLADLQKKIVALGSIPVSSFKPASACQLVDQVTPNRGIQVDLSAGFPKIAQRLPSSGHIKSLIVPVDFTDIQGKDNTVSYFSTIATGVRDFYFKQSYGAVAFDFDIVSSWIHAPFSSTKYGTGGSVGAGDVAGYLNAIISLTDGAIDYSGYDAVYFLVPKEMPMANMGWGPAITSPHWISNGVILNGATGGADMYYVENNGIKGGTWKWMAHETGHAFGLYDEDLNHASQSLGYWGIMAMSWSNNAIELGAWDRYLQGWLPQSQVNCVEMNALTTAGVSTKISPIVRQDKEVKTIMVPISSSKILVIESRKSESLDNIPANREGVLVYTVDMKKGQLGGGYEIQKRVGSTDPNFEDAALHAGDSITVGGVKITVSQLSASGDTVKISKG
jgi:M6 family metalloprotease-like protein